MNIGRKRKFCHLGTLPCEKGKWATILPILGFQERKYIILRLISEAFACLSPWTLHLISLRKSHFVLTRFKVLLEKITFTGSLGVKVGAGAFRLENGALIYVGLQI